MAHRFSSFELNHKPIHHNDVTEYGTVGQHSCSMERLFYIAILTFATINCLLTFAVLHYFVILPVCVLYVL